MTEAGLPEELKEQAMLYALGVLDQRDSQAFMVRLQGESDLLRQEVKAYHATTRSLADAVAPVKPPTTLRERLVNHIALEAARETEQFERVANTLALGAVPVTPRDSVRERLLSRIQGHTELQLPLEDPASAIDQPAVLRGEESARESQLRSPHDAGSRFTWLSYWRTALPNFLRTIVIRAMTSERVRYWKARVTLQQPTKGLTFIRASEGTWRGIAPGVMAKVLSFDPASRRTTALLRFAAGTRYAPHRHTAVEELLVLEGGCSIAGREMTIGDYHRADVGTEHYDTSTNEGCLLLVISSPQNEMLQ